MKKAHEPSFDIIRAISAIAIVLSHYSYTFYEYAIRESGPEFLGFKNGDAGGIFVDVFFMLSGAALLYNHESFSGVKDILNFYKKRWLAIFPMFYIAWTVMYIINSLRVGSWFWGGPRRNFLLSFIGMDGYFLHLGMNYYNLGEWFLGGIILLYLLYPLLNFLWNKAKIPSTILITFIFLFNLRRHYFSSAPDTNIFIVFIKYYNSHIVISDNMCLWTCIMNFWAGFILVKAFLPFAKKLDLKRSLIAAVPVLLLIIPFFLVELPLHKQESCTILAVLFYMLLTFLSPLLTLSKQLSGLLGIISRYSYGIFLVHHVTLYGVMALVRGFTFRWITSMIFFIPLFTLIVIIGIILTKTSDALTACIGSMLRKLLPSEKQEEM
ncbi:MAG: acyltransferase family protein [Lachnospiraceae bacterium]|nr:acyltransferase family protein [Lachnospiraceae bacterium]